MQCTYIYNIYKSTLHIKKLKIVCTISIDLLLDNIINLIIKIKKRLDR